MSAPVGSEAPLAVGASVPGAVPTETAHGEVALPASSLLAGGSGGEGTTGGHVLLPVDAALPPLSELIYWARRGSAVAMDTLCMVGNANWRSLSTPNLYRARDSPSGGPLGCIFVKILEGKVIGLPLGPADTVEHVKYQIQELEVIPFNQQRLVFEGMQLEDKRMLAEYGIKQDSVLHLMLRLRGGPFPFFSTRVCMAVDGTVRVEVRRYYNSNMPDMTSDDEAMERFAAMVGEGAFPSPLAVELFTSMPLHGTPVAGTTALAVLENNNVQGQPPYPYKHALRLSVVATFTPAIPLADGAYLRVDASLLVSAVEELMHPEGPYPNGANGVWYTRAVPFEGEWCTFGAH